MLRLKTGLFYFQFFCKWYSFLEWMKILIERFILTFRFLALLLSRIYINLVKCKKLTNIITGK